MVYFIQAETGGPIKIGWTNDSVVARLIGLQVGNPYRLVIRHVIEGGRAEETALHRRFSRYRLTGEWFTPCSELVRIADALGDDGGYAYDATILAVHQAGIDSMIPARRTISLEDT